MAFALAWHRGSAIQVVLRSGGRVVLRSGGRDDLPASSESPAMERACSMESRCILCDEQMVAPSIFPALREDPDLICQHCISRSPEERDALREQAVARWGDKR